MESDASNEHLTLDLLRQVEAGEKRATEVASLALAHLLEICPDCHRAFHDWRQETLKLPHPKLPTEEDRDPQVENRLDPIGERASALEWVAELLALPPAQRGEHLRLQPRRFTGSHIASLLLKEVRSCLPGRLREAHSISCLARAVLQHGEQTPETRALYARALAHEGNALRALGELSPAEALLETARFVLTSQGKEDALAHAELDKLEGSLRRAQRRLDSARELLERAAGTYAAAGIAVEEARALIALGMVWLELQHLDKAIEVTTRAMDLARTSEDPRLLLYGSLNLANYHFCAGRSSTAREILTATDGLYDRLGDPGTLIRRRWLEGRLAEREGDLGAAETLYGEVRTSFLRDGMAFMAAMVGKCLTALYARQRRIAELEELTRDMVSVFEERQVYPEADAARKFLEEATGAASPTVH